jgi:hypothetical protein
LAVCRAVVGGGGVMKVTIEIVDRGRGLQLSTSRITVLDLVPYFQKGCSYDEIKRLIPGLSSEEVFVVDRYYQQHKVELDEKDRQARAFREEQIREQRLRFPPFEGTHEEHMSRLRHLLEKRRQESNGERNPG